jgi:hypothetical protein
MSLPTLDKEWVFTEVNQEINELTNADLIKTTWLTIKNSLKTLGWVVRGSSNGVVANTNDNWTTISDLVFSSGSHSWIVMSNTALSIEICIDFDSSTVYYFDFWLARSSYNLGSPSISAKPTATYEWQIYAGETFISSTTLKTNVHILSSNEASPHCTIVMVCNAQDSSYGYTCTYFIFNKPKNVSENWVNPCVLLTENNYSNGPTQEHYTTKSDNFLFHSTNKYNFYCTGETVDGGLIVNRINGFPADLSSTGGKVFSPIGIFCDEVGARGSNGVIQDLWWGPLHDAIGTLYSSTSKTFLKVGDLIVPWDGVSIPKLA